MIDSNSGLRISYQNKTMRYTVGADLGKISLLRVFGLLWSA